MSVHLVVHMRHSASFLTSIHQNRSGCGKNKIGSTHILALNQTIRRKTPAKLNKQTPRNRTAKHKYNVSASTMIAIVNEGKQRLNQSECRLIEFTDSLPI